LCDYSKTNEYKRRRKKRIYNRNLGKITKNRIRRSQAKVALKTSHLSFVTTRPPKEKAAGGEGPRRVIREKVRGGRLDQRRVSIPKGKNKGAALFGRKPAQDRKGSDNARQTTPRSQDRTLARRGQPLPNGRMTEASAPKTSKGSLGDAYP